MCVKGAGYYRVDSKWTRLGDRFMYHKLRKLFQFILSHMLSFSKCKAPWIPIHVLRFAKAPLCRPMWSLLASQSSTKHCMDHQGLESRQIQNVAKFCYLLRCVKLTQKPTDGRCCLATQDEVMTQFTADRRVVCLRRTLRAYIRMKFKI